MADKNIKTLLGIAIIGYMAYWATKHYRKGSVVIGPLTGEFVKQEDNIPNQVITAPQNNIDATPAINNIQPAQGSNGISLNNNINSNNHDTGYYVGPYNVTYEKPTNIMAGIKKSRVGINKLIC